MITTLKSTSRGQVRGGDEPCGGSLSANLRVDGQKQHIRLNFGASKHDIAMSTRIKEDGKCCDCVGKVHALTRGDLLYMRNAGGTKRLEDRGKRNTLLLVSMEFSAFVGNGHVAEEPSVNQTSVEYVVSRESMIRAWKKVRSNKGKPGIDNISIERYPKWVKYRWEGFKEQLLKGEFKPRPVLRVEIPKDSGDGVRKLGIPAVMERVIMQAIAWVLTSVFEPLFSESSFGFRPGRSVQDAARQAQCYYQKGYGYQINPDLEKFFDTVNHDILMNRVSRQIKDKGILRLIGTFLRAGVMVDGRLNATRKSYCQKWCLS